MSSQLRSMPLSTITGGWRQVTACVAVVSSLAGCTSTLPESSNEEAIAQRVEVVRTEHGVVHLMAQDLEAAGFGLAWAQSEDYGDRVALGLVSARGTAARHLGRDEIEDDFVSIGVRARAEETWPDLTDDTRAVYRGFAAGINHRLRLFPELFPEWMTPDFVGQDVLARDVQSWSRGDAADFRRARQARIGQDPGPEPASDGAALRDPRDGPDDGSNAWALAPSRTEAGYALLLRNPHLSWDAGYYEAHIRIPDVLDFYGDFRIGGPFGIIGGFNRHLGWATTNNSPTLSQVYELRTDPDNPESYLLDGTSRPLSSSRVTVTWVDETGTLADSTITEWHTEFGPVIDRAEGAVFVLKDARDGVWRRGEQFLQMMQATNLSEWTDAVAIRAHSTSNFTYADAAGNIHHLWNARLPALPHAFAPDSAIAVSSADQMWSALVPFDQLPALTNPAGGYVQQSNDPPDYINLSVPMDRDTMPHNLPPARLRLRTQHSLELVDGTPPFTLESMVRIKHSPRMLAAERMVDDLIGIALEMELAEVAAILSSWDRTAAADSRGGLVFEAWFERYSERVPSEAGDRIPWSPEAPMSTPRGIGNRDAAKAALAQAIDWMADRDWPLDGEWGEFHRVRRGEVDVPVSGCSSALGCFRVLGFSTDEDGRRRAVTGDGWVLAVEFGPVPRGFSVLAYGQSDLEDRPWYADQAADFAAERLKPIRFTDADIQAGAVDRYHPGR